jgi:hypothetical protein
MLRVSLSGLTSWNPSNLLTSEIAQLEHNDFPLKSLDQLVDTIGERNLIPKGSKTLSARNLNESGAWRSQTSKSDHQGLTANNHLGLRLDDLVLYPGRPPLRITAEESGLAFIGNFMALRPKSAAISLWLWGLLNTSLGRSWLQRLSSVNGSVAPRFSDTLLSGNVAAIADEDPTFIAQLSNLSDSIQAKARKFRETNSESASWFRRTCINSDTDWNFVFVSDKVMSRFEGVPLDFLLESVEVGKVLSDISGAEDDSMALVTHRTLSTGEYGIADHEYDSKPLKSGTLVVASHGLRSLAAVTDRDAVLGKGVLALHLKPGVDPHWIRDFFNSEVAQAQRKALVRGVAIPFITKTAIRGFMIPDVFEGETQASQTLSEACDDIFRH